MAHLRRSAFTPFTRGQMYALVNDVEAYPAFLPWCSAGEILAHEAREMTARITVRKSRFDYAFATRNTLVPDERIEMALVDGPFKRLHGLWLFEDADGGSLVTFDIDFEFSGKLLGAALTAAFSPIADSMVEAFRKRAYIVYGR